MASTTERVQNVLFLGAEAFAKYRGIIELQQRSQDSIAFNELRNNLYPELTAATTAVGLNEVNTAEKTKLAINRLTSTTMAQARQSPIYNSRLEDQLKSYVSGFYTEGLTRKMTSILQSPEDTAITIIQQGSSQILENFIQGKAQLADSLATLFENLENALPYVNPQRLNKLSAESVKGLFNAAVNQADKTDPEALQNILELSEQFNEPAVHQKLEQKVLLLKNKATRQNFLDAYGKIVNGSQSLPSIAVNNPELNELYRFVQDTKGLSPKQIREQAKQSSSELIRKGGAERAALIEYGMQSDSAKFLSSQGIWEQPTIDFNNPQSIIEVIQKGEEQLQELSSLGKFSTFLTEQNRNNLRIFLNNAPIERRAALLQTINASASFRLKPILTGDVARVDKVSGGLLELLAMDNQGQGSFLASYANISSVAPTRSIRDSSASVDIRTINALTSAYSGGYEQIGEALAQFFREADGRRDNATVKQIKKLNQGSSNVIMPNYQGQNPVKLFQKIIKRNPQNVYRIFDNGQKIYSSDDIEITSFDNLSSYLSFKNLGGGAYRLVLSSPTMLPIELHYEDGSAVIFTIDDYAKFNSF